MCLIGSGFPLPEGKYVTDKCCKVCKSVTIHTAMALAPTERKLFLGARMKRMRRELGLTQTRMAEDLGVSPSYLNLLERNQRPVTAQVLLRLAEAYDLDLKTLSSDPESTGATGLGEVFSDA